jgi:hypothetical protein
VGVGSGLGFGGATPSSRQWTNASTTTTNNNNNHTSTAAAPRPDSRTSHSGHSARSGDSSDTEPIVVMNEPTPINAHALGNTIDGRGKVPFGQWKMPSSASASPTPRGSGAASTSPVPTGGGKGGAGAGEGARRDSISADKALREVEKALRGVETQG